jgi:DnaJ family protein C protein 25
MRFLALAWCCLLAPASPDDSSSSTTAEDATTSATPRKESRTYDFDIHNTDWGTYHDPKGVFCGKYDCYRILGFDYETFGSPDHKVITQHYRSLSREWHPDKSKHKDAKERFVKIARAYEVLSNRDVRKEYDELRYDVHKYYNKYGASVLWNYAPQTDTAVVILMLLVLANVVAWYAQKQRWQQVADRLIKAALEDWTPSQGGTPESKELRQHALSILEEREKQKEEDDAAVVAKESAPETASPGKPVSAKKQAKKGKEKLSLKEKKKLEYEALRPIIVEIVSEMKDFGGGYHLPTWRDLLILSLLRLPIKLAKGIPWFVMYYVRRLRGKELNDNEKMVLTERAVGPVIWSSSSDKDREELVKRELWIVANLAQWSEDQEFDKLSNAEKKAFKKMKKKGIKQPDGDINDMLKED